LLGESFFDEKPSSSSLPDWVINDRPQEITSEDRFVDEMMGSMW